MRIGKIYQSLPTNTTNYQILETAKTLDKLRTICYNIYTIKQREVKQLWRFIAPTVKKSSPTTAFITPTTQSILLMTEPS